MGKIVINSCYGGFSLSKEAVQRYWDLKNQQVWIEDDQKFLSLGLFTVWLVSPSERLKSNKQFESMTINERIQHNKKYREQTWCNRDVERNDPILVQVVEELGDKANGVHAELRVVEVQGPYRIEEYDGRERVETPDEINWSYA